MQSETKKQSFMGKWSSSAAVACLALILCIASTGYGDIIFGNWENSMDGWVMDDATAADPCLGVGNTLNNYSLKVAVPAGWHLAVECGTGLLPDITTATTITVDITLKASEWELGSGWVKAIENVVLQDDMSSWQQLNPVGGDSAVGWDGTSDQTFTVTFNVPAQTGPFTWAKLVFVTQYDGVTTAGNFYFDNLRSVTSPMTVTKSTVTAGKTQYLGDEDYNDMKDVFTASGTLSLPADCNDINEVVVTITSVTDGNVIYTETLSDFNATIVNTKGSYKHTAKVLKGQPGKISSLMLNFRKGTFTLATKNLDLTGLTCPVEIKIALGSTELIGTASETVVNGSKKTIPTRLMRLYDDKLVVTKANAKHKTTPATDSLYIYGDIAVADMNLDANEPNLVDVNVILTWGDANDTNVQTFTIPAGSFVAAKKGHSYKCNKIDVDPCDAADVNDGVVTAMIDLDKCTFKIWVRNAEDLFAERSYNTVFNISFETPNGVFNEEDDSILP